LCSLFQANSNRKDIEDGVEKHQRNYTSPVLGFFSAFTSPDFVFGIQMMYIICAIIHPELLAGHQHN
jgi:hypothetical protein